MNEKERESYSNVTMTGEIISNPIVKETEKGNIQNFILRPDAKDPANTFSVRVFSNDSLEKGSNIKVDGYVKHDVWQNDKGEWNHKTHIQVGELSSYDKSKPSINKVKLVGDLTKDPMSRKVKTSDYSMATLNTGDKGKNHISIDAWGKKSIALNSCVEGDKLEAQGKMVRSTWPDKAKPGAYKERITVVVDSIDRVKEKAKEEISKEQEKPKTKAKTKTKTKTKESESLSR